ncbi:MAG: proteasome assembly chaperone family protein, partial [Thermoplasmatales archaeon]|nr:proteasome assembly chaperone family protein [Thermoplasmatales archaeon]
TIELVNNEFYYWKSKNKKQRDLILLTGDYQGLSSQGQYELVEKILDIIEELGVKEMVTLGGYGLGHEIGDPKVLCATTDKDLVKTMKKYGAIFKKNEPGGGIVGASGLLLGLGKLRGIQGTCLMGETPGYLVDPKSAKAVLKILMKITNVDINLAALEKKAKEIEHIAHQLKEMESLSKEKSEELKYIG